MDIEKYLNIPASCSVGNTIFKKLFYDNANLSTKDKNLFVDGVNKITWVYCLKPETINISAYKDAERDYPEIEVIVVDLATNTRVNRIAEIIMRTIPYPILLIFKFEDKMQLYVAHQKINQNDSSKNTLEEFISTDWLSNDSSLFPKLNIKNMRFTNYYMLYSDIVDSISIYNLSSIMPVQPVLTGEQARQLTNKIQSLEQEIAFLKSKLKKETQFNQKVELNIEIKKLELQKKQLIGGEISGRT